MSETTVKFETRMMMMVIVHALHAVYSRDSDVAVPVEVHRCCSHDDIITQVQACYSCSYGHIRQDMSTTLQMWQEKRKQARGTRVERAWYRLLNATSCVPYLDPEKSDTDESGDSVVICPEITE